LQTEARVFEQAAEEIPLFLVKSRQPLMEGGIALQEVCQRMLYRRVYRKSRELVNLAEFSRQRAW
jgi:hypothetical protein